MGRPVTGPSGDNPITDEQCIEVIAIVGQPPGEHAAACPTCGYGPGHPCRSAKRRSLRDSINTLPPQVRTHVTRLRAVDKLMQAWRAQCATAWNARHAKEVSRG